MEKSLQLFRHKLGVVNSAVMCLLELRLAATLLLDLRKKLQFSLAPVKQFIQRRRRCWEGGGRKKQCPSNSASCLDLPNCSFFSLTFSSCCQLHPKRTSRKAGAIHSRDAVDGGCQLAAFTGKVQGELEKQDDVELKRLFWLKKPCSAIHMPMEHTLPQGMVRHRDEVQLACSTLLKKNVAENIFLCPVSIFVPHTLFLIHSWNFSTLQANMNVGYQLLEECYCLIDCFFQWSLN